MFPWWSNLCSDTTANGGATCNPATSLTPDVTANCSSMPVDNVLDLTVLNNTKGAALTYKYCDLLTGVPQLNRWTSISVTNPSLAGLSGYQYNDYGLLPSSPLYALRPQFQSCPRQYAGPQKFLEASYYWNYNIPKPDVFDTLLAADGYAINDMYLAAAA